MTILPGSNEILFADTMPYLDIEQMLTHLELLHEGAEGYICIANVSAKRKGAARWTHVWNDNTTNIRAQFTGFPRDYLVNDQKLQMYTAVGSFKSEMRKKEHSKQLPGMWADIDLKPEMEGHFRSSEQLDAFMSLLPEPTMIVASGSGGIHPYWLLDKRINTNVEVERLLAGWHAFLQETAGGIIIDNVQETARVLRVAGSVRWSKITEIAKGAPSFTRVELIKTDGPRYVAKDLAEIVTPCLTRLEQRIAERKVQFTQERTAAWAMLEGRGLMQSSQLYLENQFNENQDWGDLLERAGWTLSRDNRGNMSSSSCRYWVRPGVDVGGHAGASTDYADSKLITFFSSEVDRLDELIHPGVPQAMHGCTTKYRFALITLFDGDEAGLIKRIASGKGRLSE